MYKTPFCKSSHIYVPTILSTIEFKSKVDLSEQMVFHSLKVSTITISQYSTQSYNTAYTFKINNTLTKNQSLTCFMEFYIVQL